MAVLSEESLPVEQYDDRVVITLPDEIDLTYSPSIRETLRAVIRRQPAVIVADMTATTFCDSNAMHAIATTHRQAVAAGADLRLVIGHPGVRRLFALSGFDTVISIYPNLPAALSGTADTMAGGAG
jgi:anti-anti-sigma factor